MPVEHDESEAMNRSKPRPPRPVYRIEQWHGRWMLICASQFISLGVVYIGAVRGFRDEADEQRILLIGLRAILYTRSNRAFSKRGRFTNLFSTVTGEGSGRPIFNEPRAFVRMLQLVRRRLGNPAVARQEP